MRLQKEGRALSVPARWQLHLAGNRAALRCTKQQPHRGDKGGRESHVPAVPALLPLPVHQRTRHVESGQMPADCNRPAAQLLPWKQLPRCRRRAWWLLPPRFHHHRECRRRDAHSRWPPTERRGRLDAARRACCESRPLAVAARLPLRNPRVFLQGRGTAS